MNKINPKNISKQIIRTTLLCFTLLLISWGDSWDDMEKAAAGITSIQAGFVQEKHLEILSRPLVSKGKFYYQRPSSLRWEYNEPVASVLFMDGGSVRRYIKSGSGFTEDSTARMKAMGVVLQEITKWLGGRFDRNPDFNAVIKKAPEKKILLTPKNETLAKIISVIELTPSSTPGIIERVTIREGEKNFTVLKFTGIRINEKINGSLFKKL